MKNLSMILAGALMAVMFVACDSTNSTTDAITGDQAPACTVVPTAKVNLACDQYREALCSRHVDCGTYGSMAECDTWFNGQYGDCAEAPTDAIDAAAQANLKTCLCDLPDAVCTALVTDGAEATIPACGQF